MANVSKLQGTNNTTYDIVSKITRGIAVASMGSSSTATAFVATADNITSLYDGCAILLKNTVIRSASGCTINLNSLGAKRIKLAQTNGYVTTHYLLNSFELFVYSSADDCWIMMAYDSNTTYSNMSASELEAGTATTARSISAKVLNDWLDAHETVPSAIICKTSNGSSEYESNVGIFCRTFSYSNLGTTDSNGCIDITNYIGASSTVIGVSCYVFIEMGSKVEINTQVIYKKGTSDMGTKILLRFLDTDGVPYLNTAVSSFFNSSSGLLKVYYIKGV